MKYLLCLVALSLLLLVATARAQVPAAIPRATLPVVMASPPPPQPEPEARDVVEVIVDFLTPRIDDRIRIEKDKDTWARLSRLSIPDKDASSEYMLKGILSTAALTAGAVSLGFFDTSYRAPRVAVKACRAGAMIGFTGEF